MRLILLILLMQFVPLAHSKERGCLYHLSKFLGSYKNHVLDLRDRELEPHVAEYVKTYWEHVRDVYERRLKLEPGEINGFMKSSRELTDRTVLITNQIFGIFNGGVAMVYSSKASELLPFEKATGFILPRKGIGIEITRFVSDHSRDHNLSRDILETVGKILEYENVKGTLYAFTSKRHGVLYRRLGIPHKTHEISDRDIVIEFTVRDYIETLLH